jgi:hypothetical protein
MSECSASQYNAFWHHGLKQEEDGGDAARINKQYTDGSDCLFGCELS